MENCLTKGGVKMIVLKVGWETALEKAFREHRKPCKDPACVCRDGLGWRKRVKEIQKMVLNGTAKMEE